MATNDPFGAKAIPASLKAEIQRRQTNGGIDWAATRFPWIKVRSMSSGCNANFATLTSLSGNLYEDGYKRPLPAITGLDVKKQGELGTTRTAALKLLAFTDTQLIELQKCYFIPGMSVRVEWGWSVGPNNLTSKSPFGQSEDSLTDSEATGKIVKYAETNPNYEGFQGIVTQFQYQLTQDNYWDCSIEIISAVEVVGESPINTYDCNVASEKEDENTNEEWIETDSTLYSVFKGLFENYDKAIKAYLPGLKATATKMGVNSGLIGIEKVAFNAAARDELGQDDSSWYEGQGAIANQPDTEEPFISWATLEAAINRYTMTTTKGEWTTGKVMSNGVLLTYFECADCFTKAPVEVMSSDPYICILPGTKNDKLLPTPMKSATCITKNRDGKKAVALQNIMVNAVFLLIELRAARDSGGTITSFLTNVLNKINESCGNLWSLELVNGASDSEISPTLTVVDTKVYGKNAEVYSIPGSPTNSILRDFKLQTKLTESMKSQALYANKDSQPAGVTKFGGGCGSDQLKGFRLYGEEVKNKAYKETKPDPKPCEEVEQGTESVKEPTLDELIEKARENTTTRATDAIRSALINAYSAAIRNGQTDHCAGMPLPVEFGFTVDGIGGFKFGQLLTCDRIPQAIRDAFNFQVTSVEHSVTAQDWTTTVTTIFRPK